MSTPEKIERGVLGLIEPVVHLFEHTVRNVTRRDDGAVAVAGLAVPETFATSIENGGRSRFLPALAIASAALSPDPQANPREYFEQFIEALSQKGRHRPKQRSDKPRSTLTTMRRLVEGEVECLNGVKVMQATPLNIDSGDRLREAYIPTTDEEAVLLMPFDRRIFATTSELSDDVAATPLWGVAFGAHKHPDEEAVPAASFGEIGNKGGLDIRLDSYMYNVAFPVPNTLHAGDEGEGTIEPIPALAVVDMFTRAEIMPGYPNMAYVVSAEPLQS